MAENSKFERSFCAGIAIYSIVAVNAQTIIAGEMLQIFAPF
jgi:hypothetical protein